MCKMKNTPEDRYYYYYMFFSCSTTPVQLPVERENIGVTKTINLRTQDASFHWRTPVLR